MRGDAPNRIERWFVTHQDGEFGYDARLPFEVIGPAEDAGPIVFATKSARVMLAAAECAESGKLGIIARYGLPREQDIRGIGSFVGSRKLLFLGDMDPPDLLIFAYLRLRLSSKTVEHLGVNDVYLTRLQVDVPQSFILKGSPAEQSSLQLLSEVVPDLREILGPKCTAVLQGGRKIELEAVISSLGKSAPILRPAFQS